MTGPRMPSRTAVTALPDDQAHIVVTFDDNRLIPALFGEFDANLVQLENRLGVYISARGNRIQIDGSDDGVARAREVLKNMHQRLLEGQDLDAGAIEALIAMSSAFSGVSRT